MDILLMQAAMNGNEAAQKKLLSMGFFVPYDKPLDGVPIESYKSIAHAHKKLGITDKEIPNEEDDDLKIESNKVTLMGEEDFEVEFERRMLAATKKG